MPALASFIRLAQRTALSLVWQGRGLKTPILPLVGLRDNATHSRRRKPWNRAFSTVALKNYEPIIARRSSELVELLAEKKHVDFAHWVHLFTYAFSLSHQCMMKSYISQI